jgi:hypothetical protein
MHYQAVGFNVAMTAAATHAYLVGLADAVREPACATVATFFASAVPAALFVPPAIASLLVYVVALLSWRAHARGAAPTSALCGVRPLDMRRLSDLSWLHCSYALLGFGRSTRPRSARRAASRASCPTSRPSRSLASSWRCGARARFARASTRSSSRAARRSPPYEPHAARATRARRSPRRARERRRRLHVGGGVDKARESHRRQRAAVLNQRQRHLALFFQNLLVCGVQRSVFFVHAPD